MFITNKCLGKDFTDWFEVTPVTSPDGRTAFRNNDNKYASVRADYGVIFVDGIGMNESFTMSGGTASTVIGEGPRVIGIAQ